MMIIKPIIACRKNALFSNRFLRTEKEAADALTKAKANKALKDAEENSFDKEGLTDTLAKPVFAAQKGDYVGPVQSPLGWHIIYVKDIQAASVQPYESVSAKIKDELRKNKTNDEAYEITNAIEDRLPLAMIWPLWQTNIN